MNTKKGWKKFWGILVTAGLFLSMCLADMPPGQTNKENKFAKPDNEIAIAWNRMAYTVAYEHDQFYSFIGVRALAMTHIAIHDALNAIQPEYEQYAFKGRELDAHPIAAASQAAYEVLASVYPDRKDTLFTELQEWLLSVEEGKAKELGIGLGKKTAAAIIQMREGDGHEKKGGYTPMTKPGDYQYTPGYDYVWKPDFSYARPFVLDTVTQFRAPPPPALKSKAYAKAYNEVKKYGVKNSTVRSEDETNYAHWWAEFGEHGWNRIGRITAKEQNIPLIETNRMFALINMNLYDLYLASFESKYFYDFWRPYTAIRNGGDDGNPATVADTSWIPEMLTPPWPEYPSTHAAVGAGRAEIFTYVYGTADISFEMESVTALPSAKVRRYENLDQAAEECANSRIMNGYHFRFATEQGKIQGRKVAKYVYSHVLRSVDGVGNN